MQARLDLLLPSPCCATVIPDVSLCCPRSTGADDDAPFLVAMPLLLLERGLEFVIRHAPAANRLAAITRQ
ncbi:hypothetical protein [Opitutus terrae]|uniref:Uncharacterized protein n=1 Tax=Opitutus terrae (strain DSM 11246 / JCM 15787 / PB90-1) TaxID=452637 RepID=B1ZML4_OPITP|nr:hypothetical protein [Opitutus terrae]ACB74359.1 hypothetical protein Oter_1071 [Opitutus terrae PB90-1]